VRVCPRGLDPADLYSRMRKPNFLETVLTEIFNDNRPVEKLKVENFLVWKPLTLVLILRLVDLLRFRLISINQLFAI
jgi:hypothetical protein